MKRQILVNGLLSLTAVALLTGCKDDKYDLSDIDTTSRFIVDNLTVPVRLQKIELKNVIDFDDDDPDALVKEENGEYVISRAGDIDDTEFNLDGINVEAPHVDPISITIPTDNLPSLITPAIPIPAIDLPEVDKKTYDFSMDNVEKALEVLDNIKTTPISIKVTLSVPSELTANGNSLSFQDLNLTLPWGLITNDSHYKKNGSLHYDKLKADANGKAVLEIIADGLDLLGTGTVENGNLGISGEVGIDSGKIKIDVAQSVNMPSPFKIDLTFEISGFDVTNFSGKINYEMDNIDIAPISLNDLPDFLDSPETNLIIANPKISVAIQNPVAKYGLVGKGKLTMTSTFSNGESIVRSSEDFYVKQNGEDNWCYLTLSQDPTNESTGNYQFPGLGYVLTNQNPNPNESESETPGWGLPESISVSIGNLVFAGQVTDFPLTNIGKASGNYSFTAPLGFGKGTKIIYETTEGDWGGDDMDDVNITKVMVEAKCETNLPVSVKLYIIPIDKNGEEIKVVETKEFNVPANAKGEKVVLSVEALPGHTITDFDGVKFRAIVSQDGDNTNAIGPNLYIFLDELKATVAGYYETSF